MNKKHQLTLKFEKYTYETKDRNTANNRNVTEILLAIKILKKNIPTEFRFIYFLNTDILNSKNKIGSPISFHEHINIL